MKSRHELHLDLSECVLEGRVLPALPVGVTPSPFMQINTTSNQIIVPGSSTSGGGPGSTPGPSWYYLRLGVNLNTNGSGVVGSTIGGTVSIYGLRSGATAIGGGGR